MSHSSKTFGLDSNNSCGLGSPNTHSISLALHLSFTLSLPQVTDDPSNVLLTDCNMGVQMLKQPMNQLHYQVMYCFRFKLQWLTFTIGPFYRVRKVLSTHTCTPV